MDLQPLHVLIVEDSENSTILMLRALRQGGYETFYRRVQTEKNMRAALDDGTWDLILSDHDMPRFSATKALAVFQESGLEIPFLIVSGAIGEEIAIAAMKAGAYDFIMKKKLAHLVPAVQRELREAENRRERRKAEEALRRREQEFKALVENAPDIVARFDRTMCCLYVNPAIEQETGIDRHFFLQRSLDELQLDSQALKLWQQAITQVFLGGEEQTIYFDFSLPGEKKKYHARIVPEFDPGSKVETVLSITRNITEVKRIEAELQQELEKTRRLHLRSLPQLPPSCPGTILAAHYRPAAQLKGDFYNIIQKKGRLFFYLADVKGQGLDGVTANYFVRNQLEKSLETLRAGDFCFTPEKMLEELLEQFERENPDTAGLLSIVLGVLDPQAGVLQYSLHGFCSPQLLTVDCTAVDRQCLQREQRPGEGTGPGQFF